MKNSTKVDRTFATTLEGFSSIKRGTGKEKEKVKGRKVGKEGEERRREERYREKSGVLEQEVIAIKLHILA